ncbi:hypothetical protein ACVNIS_24865 (plasmid) [Sphaerotilaceae bacterium SBD11-9]
MTEKNRREGMTTLTMAQLQTLAAKVQTAQRRVDKARNAVALDKQARASSFLARLKDLFTTTEPEARLHDAEKRLTGILAEGQAAALKWVLETAKGRLMLSSTDSKRHAELRQQSDRETARLAQVTGWLSLARSATDNLVHARDKCRSASSTELLDLVSTSKVLAAASSMETSSAAQAVEDAAKAVGALIRSLPKRAESQAIELPDDLLDLIVDLAFAPSLDLLSLFNMCKLDDAARKCQESIDKLQPLLARLSNLSRAAQARVDQRKLAVQRIEVPYIEAAAAVVPNVLKAPVRCGLFA